MYFVSDRRRISTQTRCVPTISGVLAETTLLILTVYNRHTASTPSSPVTD